MWRRKRRTYYPTIYPVSGIRKGSTFIHSCVQSFIHSFIHSFVHSIIVKKIALYVHKQFLLSFYLPSFTQMSALLSGYYNTKNL